MFDPRDWPDPDAMIAELKSLGIELMVSVWPTVDNRTELSGDARKRLAGANGTRIADQYGFPRQHDVFDATHHGARDYVWGKAKRNYYDKGVTLFWLDEAEPEFSVYDYDNYRYHAGPVLEVGNIYPRMYAKTFDGMKADGEDGLSTCCAAHGPAARNMARWSGPVIFTLRFDRYAISLPPDSIWGSREYRGGQRISVVFMAVIFTTPNSMSC